MQSTYTFCQKEYCDNAMIAINSLELWQNPQIYNLIKAQVLSPCTDATQIRKINTQSKTK